MAGQSNFGLSVVKIIAALFLSGLASTAMAQNAPCAWGCLPGDIGPQTPCYGAECPPDAPTVPNAPWSRGVAADGRTHYAGIDAGDGTGRGLFYMCGVGGESYLMLYALERPQGVYELRIGEHSVMLPFDRARRQLTVSLPANAEVLGRLAQGDWVRVLDPEGVDVMALGLRGSRAALDGVRQSCRS